MKSGNSKTVNVEYLSRVEGEGFVRVTVKRGSVAEVKFGIFEPPRFFEAFLRGRHFTEAPDITARICGICPVAYQMSSVHAMEQACGVRVDGQLRALRRLLYCGEWIESHALHIYMLHVPDFLGFEDVIALSRKRPDEVKTGLKLKSVGNAVVSLLGGREIHPVNVRVGGFYKLPTRDELAVLVPQLEWARAASLETVELTSRLKFPDFEQEYEFVSLRHPDEYPLNEGRIVSNKGLDIDVRDYERQFAEEHVQHSNALRSVNVERGAYMVGPLARYNLNFDKLTPAAQNAARGAGLGTTCANPFKSIVVRAVETLYACEEALRIIDRFVMPERAAVEVQPRLATGMSCTEAPRGLLFHRYRIDEKGLILDARIVPPTAQNQVSIEHDLKNLVGRNLRLSQDKLTWLCEQAVRNYDPCISCATHAVKLELELDSDANPRSLNERTSSWRKWKTSSDI